MSAQPAPRSGLDTKSFDRSVRPQDDLYRHVNGGWLARTEIPPERSSYAAFIELVDKVDADILAIVEELRALPGRRQGSVPQQVSDLYGSLMDEARLERLGATPIQPVLDRIEAIRTTRDFAAQAGYLQSIGTTGAFVTVVSAETGRRERPALNLSQGGTMLPDRDYYLSADPKLAESRAAYEAYLTRVFTLTHRPDPARDARAVLGLETALARVQWSAEAGRDPLKTNNVFTIDGLRYRMPGFDWWAWARPQGISPTTVVVIAQPSFFVSFSAMVPTTPLDTWKAWLLARHVTNRAPFLSRAFSDARFEFFGRALVGQEMPRTRWRRGVGLVNTYLGEAVGRLYVERHFPPEARARMHALVRNLIEAYRTSIEAVAWMTDGTRRQALEKLSRLSTKIGSPDRWRDYRGLVIRADDLVGNVQRAQRSESDHRLTWLTRPSALTEWLVTPQTVNAYYHPAINEVVFPAAMLQPPFFEPDADEAVNYGAIGAVIGHEISHAFDDRGRHFDSQGAVRDWWTPRDDQEYRRRVGGLVEQFDRYSPLPGLHINGSLTLGENIGDLAGLQVAYRAYTLSRAGRPAPVIDGLTGDQRFFMGWAQVWRSKEREGFLRQLTLTGPHSPSEFRAVGPLSHIDAFYEAFDVKPGDKMYVEPSKRVRIW
ncbi:MAG TPA: M13 family metallopeptidase [Vicinamibacterales bacterium]|nr:M13 family metallopeptidase [Vicinamibacterales bacterium]